MVDDITKPRYQDDGKTPLVDATGKQLYEQKEETYKVGEIKPCYATDNAWKDLDVLTQFYYYSKELTVPA